MLRRSCIIIVAIVFMLSEAPDVLAGGGYSSGSPKSDGSCLFTIQLKDPSIKRQYIAKITAAVQRNVSDSLTADDMYNDIRKASLVENDAGHLKSPDNGRSTATESSAGFGSLTVTLTADDKYTDTRGASLEKYDGWDLDSPDSAAMESSGGIDNLSIICLGCHDGVTAQSVAVNLRNDPSKRSSTVNSKNSDHPIGMDYRLYASFGRGYKWININSTNMIFVDGKVGCLTCHDPLNPEKTHLVMSDRRSALCLTCHNK